MSHGERGKHRSPRRVISGTREQWEAWDRVARKHGTTWAVWARTLMDTAVQVSAELGPFAPTSADVRRAQRADIRGRRRAAG